MTTGKAKERILERVLNSDHEVFLRSDFSDIANYQQAGRALNSLMSEGRLIRISKGVYAKARKNRITGKPMLSAAGGFIAVAEEAYLKRGAVKFVTVPDEPLIVVVNVSVSDIDPVTDFKTAYLGNAYVGAHV